MKTDRLYALTLYLLNHGKSLPQRLPDILKYLCGQFKGISTHCVRRVFLFVLLPVQMAGMKF